MFVFVSDVKQITSQEVSTEAIAPAPAIPWHLVSKVKCCFDNPIGGCTPGSESENRCDSMCTNTCGSKGGFCKQNKCHCKC